MVGHKLGSDDQRIPSPDYNCVRIGVLGPICVGLRCNRTGWPPMDASYIWESQAILKLYSTKLINVRTESEKSWL